MAAAPVNSRSPRAAPVVSLIDLPALETLLERAGYRRIVPSRLGECAPDISLWEGRKLFVILMPERLVVGAIGSHDWRIRTTIARVDPPLLRFIRADRGEDPPSGDSVPESGPWPTR